MDSQELFKEQIIFNEETVGGMTYIGKTPNILKIEKNFDSLINKNLANKVTRSNDVFESAEMKQIKELIRKEFGFGYVDIINDNLSQNFWQDLGQTLSGNNPFKDDDNLTNTILDYSNSDHTIVFLGGLIPMIYTDKPSFLNKKDKYYDYSHNYICLIGLTADTIVSGTYTAEEITAILLHEIGHNFNVTIINVANQLLYGIFEALLTTLNPYQRIKSLIDHILYETITSISTSILYPLIMSGTNIFRNLLYKNRITASMLDGLYKLVKLVSDLAMMMWPARRLKQITDLCAKVKDLAKYDISSNTLFITSRIYNEFIFKIIRYQDERFADSFATIYGYGPAAMSLYEKIERQRSTFNTIDNKNVPSLFKEYLNIGSILYELPRMVIDEHGDEQTRIKDSPKQHKKL